MTFRTFLLMALVGTGLSSVARADPKVVTGDELAARLTQPADKRTFELFDARARVEFDEQHIAGAASLPADAVPKRLPKLVPNKDRELIFYCNGPTCTKSRKAAGFAEQLGYTQVRIYDGGLPEWTSQHRTVAGHPLPKVDAPGIDTRELKAWLASTRPPVLVDVRDADEFQAFHLPRSVNFPIDDIEGRAAELPKNVPVCVVDHSGHQTEVAARLLGTLGVGPMKRLDEGVNGWRKSAGSRASAH